MKLVMFGMLILLAGCDSGERNPVAVSFPGGSGKAHWVTNEETFIVDYGTDYSVVTVINRTKPRQ